MVDYSKEDIVQVMVGMYRDSFSQTSGYRPVLEQIAAQSSPGFLFHCSAGKDRTGVFGAILMMILDFDIETIKEEYLRIDTVSLGYVKKDVLSNTGLIEHENAHVFDDMFTVLPEYLEAYLAEIEKQHENYDDYLLRKFGISAELKQRFKDRYLK